jgi:hypothetical protein
MHKPKIAKIAQRRTPVVIEVTHGEAAAVVLHESFGVYLTDAVSPRPYFNKHTFAQSQLNCLGE